MLTTSKTNSKTTKLKLKKENGAWFLFIASAENDYVYEYVHSATSLDYLIRFGVAKGWFKEEEISISILPKESKNVIRSMKIKGEA